MAQDHFSLLIGWIGPEDKPFYRALLVSASQAALIDNQPFWGYAIITKAELDRLIDVLNAHGRAPAAGLYGGSGPEYYIEMQSGGDSKHAALGFDSETLEILTQMADALKPANQQPLRDIVNRITPEIGQRD